MQRITALLPEIVREIASNSEVALVFIKELWPQMAGRDLAEKAFPLRFLGGRLTLAVVETEWEQPLKEMLPLLKRKINDYWDYPLVDTIRIEPRLND